VADDRWPALSHSGLRRSRRPDVVPSSPGPALF
jgi:hypothetical protein